MYFHKSLSFTANPILSSWRAPDELFSQCGLGVFQCYEATITHFCKAATEWERHNSRTVVLCVLFWCGCKMGFLLKLVGFTTCKVSGSVNSVFICVFGDARDHVDPGDSRPASSQRRCGSLQTSPHTRPHSFPRDLLPTTHPLRCVLRASLNEVHC